MLSFHDFEHTNESGVETYSFPSALHVSQRHEITRPANEHSAWRIGLVDVPPELTIDETKTLRHEVSQVISFAEQLPTSLQRRTEPGNPEFSGIGGGL